MEVEPTTLADAKTKRQLAEQALEEAKAQEKTLRGSANIGVALTQVERQKKDLERTFDKARPEDLPTPDVDWLWTSFKGSGVSTWLMPSAHLPP